MVAIQETTTDVIEVNGGQPSTNGKIDASATEVSPAPETNGSKPDVEDGEAAKSEEDVPEIPIGSLLEFKRVDNYWDSDQSEWVLRDSAAIKAKSTNDKYRGYSFTIVRSLDSTDYHVTSIEVELKSDLLKAACKHVIGHFDGISWNSRVLRVDPDVFMAFFPELETYQREVESKTDKTEDETTQASHLKLLLDFFRSEYGSQLAEIESLKKHGEITFDLLWAIMRPRTLLLLPHCGVTGEPRAVRLISAERRTPHQASPHWRLECEYVDATGNGARADATGNKSGPRFGMAEMSLNILKFRGTQKITSLRAYPMQWHPRPEDMQRRLVERGRRWKDLDGVHHRFYNSTAYHLKNCGYLKITVKSRIMVDIGSFKKINPNYQLPTVRGAEGTNSCDDDYYCPASDDEAEERDTTELEDTLSDDQLLLASPILYGFSLSDKLWLEFNVEHVKTFVWNDEAFERLVLPPTQKNLIRSLVDSHENENTQFDDFIEGKGQGLIINLHGCPGVGKTLSAEATSEHVRKPLYVVGAGDLGTHASVLDSSLTDIFSVAAAWKAIVLIDEADVFLEQRSLHDLSRNAMVAVFLRQLEYFRGILFLTTNRVASFDEAFQSRIHVSLRFKDLDSATRLAIWNTFLERIRLAPSTLTQAQRELLASKELNGRQIKNAARTASAVANSRGEKPSFTHVMEVLGVMEQFEQDFKDLKQGASD